MSGGTWFYENDRIRTFLEDRIQDTSLTGFPHDCPKLAKILIELGRTLDEITHDLDWHYACDSQIEDMSKFEDEALKKLAEAMIGWRK